MMAPDIKTILLLLAGLVYMTQKSFCVPLHFDNSLVVSTTTVPSPLTENNESEKEGSPPKTTHIDEMRVTSHVHNRFVHTTVLSRVKNHASKSQEATFSIILPDTAFISGFVMEIAGKNYTAYVKEKEEAKKTYDEAVASGQSAAHVAVNARDSNRFTVSVNVEPETKASFYLNYEELLKRQEDRYELVINLHPGEPVKDLSVEVSISESRKLVDLKVPPLRSGNEIGKENTELDPRADIRVIDDQNAVVTFSPNLERQKQLAGILGTNKDQGLSGQFVVQYDVERDPQGGEVLIQDGYFVHYFSPSNLQPLPKHVVFVLDTSGSMHGQKIVQLRESMVRILEQLNEHDMFQVVEFNSVVKVLNIDDAAKHVSYPKEHVYVPYGSSDDIGYPALSTVEFDLPYLATADNIRKAKDAAKNLEPSGATDIYTGLEVGLYLVELAKSHNDTHQPMIVFLTDGEPNVRVRSTDQITTKITEFNSGKRKSVLYTLAFGNYANKDFLQKLALRNGGFARQIYEAADASLQLQNFYKQISSPLLADVKFKYEASTTSLTVTDFLIHFGGSELVVAGCYGTPEFAAPVVEGRASTGWVKLVPKVSRAVSSVERLWAYLTVKQLLEKKEASDKEAEEAKKKALEVALKYQFVTSVSSLVVVKPNATSAVDTEAADKEKSHHEMDLVHNRLSHPVLQFASASLDLAAPGTPGIFGPPQYPRPIFLSTRRPLPPPPPTQDLLLFKLNWLNQILTDGVLDLTQGKYKLGLNETITDHVECLNGPLNTKGYCALIHSCKRIHDTLVSKEVYKKHFCLLKNEFAGVCCPDVVP